MLFRMMLCILALVSLKASSQTKLTGKVQDFKQRPIANVSVAIKDSYDGATTDSLGRFSFETTESGKHLLEVSAVGYNVLLKEIDISGREMEVSVELKEKITELSAVVISAGSFEAGDKKKGTVLSSLDIVTTASADGDITNALKTLPGTQVAGETGGLMVRGGTATESKIFIDGNLVNNFFYTSVPNIPTRGRFNPFLFKGTVFSSGGYSALYGQALSSALILESNDLPDKTSADIGITVLSLGGGIQKLSKKKNASWGLSYNYANLWLAFKALPQKQDYYKMPESNEGDANFRIKTKSGGMVKYYAYFGTDKVGFRTPDIDSSILKNAFNLNNINFYNNLTWKENLGKGWKITNGISFSTNKDDIGNELQNEANEKADVTTTPGYDSKNFHLTKTSFFAQWRTVAEKKLKGISMLRFGGEHFYSTEKTKIDQLQNLAPFKINENLTALFAEGDMYLSNNLALKLGTRLEHSAFLDKFNFAPRASLAYKLGKTSQASFAYGTFYQNPESRYLYGKVPNLGFAKASHYILQYLFTAQGRILRSEIFYKQYNNLYKTGPKYTSVAVDNKGIGYAQGFELFYRDKTTIKNFDYWVSYSYLDTKRQYLNFPESIQPNFVSAHTASLVMKKFFLPIKTGFNASYTYASPRPYYQILYNATTNKNEFIDRGEVKPYGSLSFSANYVPSVGKKNAKGFTVFVLSVSNVLGRNNVFGYNYGTVYPNKKEEITPAAKRFVFLGCFISLGIDRSEDAINNHL